MQNTSEVSKNFGTKHKEKILDGRLKLRWEDDIIMDLKGTGDGIWIEFIWLTIYSSGKLL
jgi:hypothetical protein